MPLPEPLRVSGGTLLSLEPLEQLRLPPELVPRDGRIRPKHEDKLIVFTLMRCRLSAVRYPKELYGEAGLTFEKSGCTE